MSGGKNEPPPVSTSEREEGEITQGSPVEGTSSGRGRGAGGFVRGGRGGGFRGGWRGGPTGFPGRSRGGFLEQGPMRANRSPPRGLPPAIHDGGPNRGPPSEGIRGGRPPRSPPAMRVPLPRGISDEGPGRMRSPSPDFPRHPPGAGGNFAGRGRPRSPPGPSRGGGFPSRGGGPTRPDIGPPLSSRSPPVGERSIRGGPSGPLRGAPRGGERRSPPSSHRPNGGSSGPSPQPPMPARGNSGPPPASTTRDRPSEPAPFESRPRPQRRPPFGESFREGPRPPEARTEEGRPPRPRSREVRDRPFLRGDERPQQQQPEPGRARPPFDRAPPGQPPQRGHGDSDMPPHGGSGECGPPGRFADGPPPWEPREEGDEWRGRGRFEGPDREREDFRPSFPATRPRFPDRDDDQPPFRRTSHVDEPQREEGEAGRGPFRGPPGRASSFNSDPAHFREQRFDARPPRGYSPEQRYHRMGEEPPNFIQAGRGRGDFLDEGDRPPPDRRGPFREDARGGEPPFRGAYMDRPRFQGPSSPAYPQRRFGDDAEGKGGGRDGPPPPPGKRFEGPFEGGDESGFRGRGRFDDEARPGRPYHPHHHDDDVRMSGGGDDNEQPPRRMPPRDHFSPDDARHGPPIRRGGEQFQDFPQGNREEEWRMRERPRDGPYPDQRPQSFRPGDQQGPPYRPPFNRSRDRPPRPPQEGPRPNNDARAPPRPPSEPRQRAPSSEADRSKRPRLAEDGPPAADRQGMPWRARSPPHGPFQPGGAAPIPGRGRSPPGPAGFRGPRPPFVPRSDWTEQGGRGRGGAFPAGGPPRGVWPGPRGPGPFPPQTGPASAVTRAASGKDEAKGGDANQKSAEQPRTPTVLVETRFGSGEVEYALVEAAKDRGVPVDSALDVKATNESVLKGCNREELVTAEKLRQEMEALKHTQFLSTLGQVQANMQRSWITFELRQAEEELLKAQSNRRSITALF